jgi:putative heme iron utilization protein
VGRAVAAHTGTEAYDRLRVRYLAANPKAELYVDLPGFWFWRLEPQAVALNGGFGKAWNGPWSEIA